MKATWRGPRVIPAKPDGDVDSRPRPDSTKDSNVGDENQPRLSSGFLTAYLAKDQSQKHSMSLEPSDPAPSTVPNNQPRAFTDVDEAARGSSHGDGDHPERRISSGFLKAYLAKEQGGKRGFNYW